MERRHNPSVRKFSKADAREMGQNIQKVRLSRGMTQESLAEIIDTDTRNVARYEQGSSLTFANIILLCQILDCTFEDILPADFRCLCSGMSSAVSNMDTKTLLTFQTAFVEEMSRRSLKTQH